MNSRNFLDALQFKSLWATGTAALSLSTVRRQQYILPASGPDAAVHLSLVARLPQQPNSGIGKVLAELERLHPSHHYYPSDTVHVTIQNFDDIKDVDRDELLARLRHRIGTLRPFSLTGHGLGVSPNSVFLQLFPEDDSLWGLRQQLTRSTQDLSYTRKRTAGPGAFRDLLFRRLAFANLIRFSGPLSPSFIRAIARHRATCFGRFTVEALELVQTDRLFSAAGTTVIDRMPLGR
ncbi:2'-5' RNA ligase family protein [Bradyrhizobium murdochi]|uniref:2'-5' RNA ligase family protein n=1 Tax=Bradyrhizobium murdochi TaxID=1038859 RepID=UPI0012EB9845|nr:hypothetical protein [Bradyrhizobium murdochi]